jgi:glycosyltransferase involved in cell wall biosynthesis
LPAAWIESKWVMSENRAVESWDAKLTNGAPMKLRVAFVGQLHAGKGVQVLLAALKKLSGSSLPLQVDIYGDGPLLRECIDSLSHIQQPITVQMRGVIAYGPEFLNRLSEYHLVVVPSLGQEQPRVIFDAFSQAVPVLASDTQGIAQVVKHDVNGLLFATGDAQQLAAALAECCQHPHALRDLGMHARDNARRFTHESMHAQRADLIRKYVLSSANSK